MFEDAKYIIIYLFFPASLNANALSVEAGMGTFENWTVEILWYGCMTFSVWKRVIEGCRILDEEVHDFMENLWKRHYLGLMNKNLLVIVLGLIGYAWHFFFFFFFNILTIMWLFIINFYNYFKIRIKSIN